MRKQITPPPPAGKRSLFRRVISGTLTTALALGGLISFGATPAAAAGEVWTALGTGINSGVHALTVGPDGSLYAGGNFTTAGGVPASKIAKYDPATGAWTPLGTGMDSIVEALTVGPDGSLYAGGNFTTVGGATVNYVAKWNGSTWSALGTGMNNTVRALAVDGSGNLVAGGDFTKAGGVTAWGIAKWNGTTWTSLGTGMDNRYEIPKSVYALTVGPDGSLYAGGNFQAAGGATVNYVAKWNGTAWSALGTGVSGTVNALTVDGSGNLYAGGDFTKAGGVTANYIAKYDPATGTWTPLGDGMNSTVLALAVGLDGALYAGGSFSTAGGVTANSIAKWNGTTWSALGTGVNNNVTALATDASGNLVAGGSFTTAGGVTVNRVAKWGMPPYLPVGISYPATVDVAYGSDAVTVEPTVSDGDGSPTFAITSGTLPDGVMFDTATGVFTGPTTAGWAGLTPAAGFPAILTVKVTDSTGDASASLTLRSTPAVPTALNVTAGNGQAALTWTAPASNGGSAVTDYTVEYRVAAGTWTVFSEAVSTATSATVTGLANGTSYEFRVAAVNAAGAGPASSVATATPRTTPGAPTGLAATPGAGSAALTWVAPAANGGAVISDYTVEYRIATTGTWTVFTRSVSTATSATVTGLANGTSYEFRVSAVNVAGTGGTSSVASAGTPATVGLGYPAATDIAYGSNSITASPTVTGGYGARTFAITAGTLPDGVSFSASTGVFTGPTTAAWAGLTPAVGFPAIITVTITDGTGSATAVLTLRSTPAKPTGIDVSTGAGFANLSWTAPALNGGSAVTGYVVEYREVGGAWTEFHGAQGFSGGDGDPSTSVTVTGLADATTYEFRVAAVNTAGTGPMSTPAEAETATVPGVPTGVAASGGDARVMLAWTAPASNGGSAITDYTVAYKPASGSMWTVVDDAVSAGTSATVTGLTNNVSYVFRVAAVNAVGTGSWSVTADGKPRPDPWRPNPVTVNGGEMGGSVGGTTDVIVACTTDPIRIQLSAPSPTDPSFGMPTVTVWNAGDNAQACAGGTLTVYAFNAAGDVLAQHTVPSLAVTGGAFHTGPVAWQSMQGGRMVDTPIPMSQFKSVYVVIE